MFSIQWFKPDCVTIIIKYIDNVILFSDKDLNELANMVHARNGFNGLLFSSEKT